MRRKASDVARNAARDLKNSLLCSCCSDCSTLNGAHGEFTNSDDVAKNGNVMRKLKQMSQKEKELLKKMKTVSKKLDKKPKNVQQKRVKNNNKNTQKKIRGGNSKLQPHLQEYLQSVSNPLTGLGSKIPTDSRPSIAYQIKNRLGLVVPANGRALIFVHPTPWQGGELGRVFTTTSDFGSDLVTIDATTANTNLTIVQGMGSPFSQSQLDDMEYRGVSACISLESHSNPLSISGSCSSMSFGNNDPVAIQLNAGVYPTLSSLSTFLTSQRTSRIVPLSHVHGNGIIQNIVVNKNDNLWKRSVENNSSTPVADNIRFPPLFSVSFTGSSDDTYPVQEGWIKTAGINFYPYPRSFMVLENTSSTAFSGMLTFCVNVEAHGIQVSMLHTPGHVEDPVGTSQVVSLVSHLNDMHHEIPRHDTAAQVAVTGATFIASGGKKGIPSLKQIVGSATSKKGKQNIADAVSLLALA